LIRAEDLHVISVISNPVRFQSRDRLFREHMDRCASSPATHWFIEASFGERPYAVTKASDPQHLQVRCDHELWLKENLINKAVEALPPDWKYVMWLDGDVEFTRPDWALEVVHALQHYQVLQPFSHVLDMGPNREGLTPYLHQGFGYLATQGLEPGNAYGTYMHPGYSWAWRREAWDAVGGMIERAICGSGDDHMAKALLGHADKSMPGGLHPNYIAMVNAWQDRAAALKRDVGFVAGTIMHHFHGYKVDRAYWGRWDILKAANYDPEADVVKGEDGLLRLADNGKYGLRDGLRRYFRARNEDSR